METDNEIREIKETNPDDTNPNPKPKMVRTKVPEVEIHLYRQGKGPIDVFKSSLGGWDQDLLEVRDILDKYGFKSVYAFNPDSGRAAPIRFNGRNGRSILGYRDGSVICIDGEPKDSLIKPLTKILFGVAVITLFITMAVKDPPEWIKKSNFFGGSFPPWILACAVIVFTRMRKRTRDFLKKHGW
ncbi:hypothetical protein P3X46_021566 [Hevea brasiliensis]|uniref:Uncharacterized protein n=1 Tax=Hevea brasiliensis TaxID=3981 RepID=A0ABQ9LHZ5_HEVBR|nr:uncharacterized protein LOC110640534 [Hevea brasiliensis]KAJ9166872.1 hypothetical protein P3X46_021566 [Hevea brasiliensis]